jgi:HD-GYP domain-containing protein (c-di-GMP phosphodiesterase class II)
MVVLQRTSPEPFTLEDFDLAQIFTGYLSLAFDNVIQHHRANTPAQLAALFKRFGSILGDWLSHHNGNLHLNDDPLVMEDTYLQAVLALARAVDVRDHFTGAHSQRLATWAVAIGKELHCSSSDIQDFYFAALLHDVGKIAMPDYILKKNGKLTEREWVVMKRHPIVGAEIVSPIKKMSRILPYIQCHHERFDGTGYPNGISGEEIPLGARILKVVDVYGAVTEDRPYRQAQSHQRALAIINNGNRTEFDPQIVAIFLSLLSRKAIHTAYT